MTTINLTIFTDNNEEVSSRNFLNFDNISHASVCGDELINTNEAKGYFITAITYDPQTDKDIVDVVFEEQTDGYVLNTDEPFMTVCAS